MSRPSRSRKAGNRGRHRHIDSPETKRFHELERDPESALNLKPSESVSRDRHGIRRMSEQPKPKLLETDPRSPEVQGKPKRSKPKPPPPRPDWLTDATYERLLELREQL